MGTTATRTYATEYRRSTEHPEEFWLEASGLVDWMRPPARWNVPARMS